MSSRTSSSEALRLPVKSARDRMHQASIALRARIALTIVVSLPVFWTNHLGQSYNICNALRPISSPQ
jgi:hypothetical protein